MSLSNSTSFSANMLRRLLFTFLIIVASTPARAVYVNTQAGQLHAVMGEDLHSNLIVDGTLDARDFKYITEYQTRLINLDLSRATIVEYQACEEDELIGGTIKYKAATIPMCGLAGMLYLQQVTLPPNLEGIDYAAFAGCISLKAISFPSSLKYIGDEAFNTCRALTNIHIGDQVEKIGKGAFAHCRYITNVVVNPVVSLSIGEEAFLDCTRITYLRLGPNVNSVGDKAFSGCSLLNEIIIMDGSKLTHIGEQAFYKSSLKSFDFNTTPALNHLGAWAFANTKLTNVSLPAHVKSLDEGIFFYNRRLTTLSLPKTLSYLPDYMLAGCDKLTSTNFMTQNMGSVGDYALYNQSQHSKITVPFKVHYLGTQAMAGMIGLQSIISEPLEVPDLGDDVWAGIKKSDVSLEVNESSLPLYQAAPQWSDFFVRVALLRGDVNGDGFVNTTDAMGERTYIVDGSSEGINTNNTDVNGDGMIDVADITSIYNIINGSEPMSQPQRTRCSDYIVGDGTLLNPHKSLLEIGIKNTTNYTSFQMTITPPPHMTITGVKTTGRCVGHEVYLKKNGYSYMLVGYSPANDDIEGYEGPIITLEIESNSNISQEETIDVKDIFFVDYQENVYVMYPVLLNLLGSSSVETIKVNDEPQRVNVYNTQGQLLRTNVERTSATSGLPTGIYIVGGKKVIVR